MRRRRALLSSLDPRLTKLWASGQGFCPFMSRISSCTSHTNLEGLYFDGAIPLEVRKPLKRSRQESFARAQSKNVKQKNSPIESNRPEVVQTALHAGNPLDDGPAFSGILGSQFDEGLREIKIVECVILISSPNSNLAGYYEPPGNAFPLPLLLRRRRADRPAGRPWPSGVPP